MMMSERETVQPTSFRPSGGLSNQLPASADARRRRACGCVRFRQVVSSKIDGRWHLIGAPSENGSSSVPWSYIVQVFMYVYERESDCWLAGWRACSSINARRILQDDASIPGNDSRDWWGASCERQHQVVMCRSLEPRITVTSAQPGLDSM